MMGDAVPHAPWDLPLLFSRMDAFRFTRCGDCRTIDLLARRIGQRGDATRAPMQVRNGRRPHGRLLVQQPAALSKDCRFFVQPTRTTSTPHERGWFLHLRALSDLLNPFIRPEDRFPQPAITYPFDFPSCADLHVSSFRHDPASMVETIVQQLGIKPARVGLQNASCGAAISAP
jgi:hypothetical protein